MGGVILEQLFSVAEISDRLAIYDLYSRYVHSADAFDYAKLDEVFDSDTVMDWTECGYRIMTWAEAKTDSLMGGDLFSHSFHINTNYLISFGPGRLTAEVVSKTINPVGVVKAGRIEAFQVQGGYVDQLVRLPDRWKIKHRKWKNAFLFSADAVMTLMSEMLEPPAPSVD